MAIITLMTAGMLLARRGAERSTEFQALAQETALIVRQAQTYGAGGRLADFGSGSVFDAIGVHIDRPNDELTIYANDPGTYNEWYQGDSSGDVTVERFSLPKNFTIDQLCTVDNPDNDLPCGGNLEEAAAVYERPDPSAMLLTKVNASGAPAPEDNKNNLVIGLKFASEMEYIVVGKAGYTYVK